MDRLDPPIRARSKPMTRRLWFKRLRIHLHAALATARSNARSDSANCRHDGSPPFCLTCTNAYVRMP
jgi:hypothetical protein